MRFRLDSSLPDDAGWTTPPTTAQRVLLGDACGAVLRDGTGAIQRRWDDPLAGLAWLDQQRRRGGRWVGFLAYELGYLLEPASAPAGWDVSAGLLYAWGWVPNLPKRLHARPQMPAGAGIAGNAISSFRSTFTRPAYLEAVARCIDYIAAGDVFQVNLSQRLAIPFRGAPAALYASLLATAPAAYGALLELEDRAIISNSPELFLRVTAEGRIITRPIKGTRPRGAGDDSDAALAAELLASAKDAAELNMIVDLERNDLGRVCEIGSVRVSEPRTIETHPSVHHGVATVEGRLRADVGLVELLRATFPGGSVTGAPKIRAMQIIAELEPAPRGAYCGAIGHLDADGSITLNVAIRTMTLGDGALHIPVGGGIVADSDPAAEHEETLVKARAMLRAAAMAERDGAAYGVQAPADPAVSWPDV